MYICFRCKKKKNIQVHKLFVFGMDEMRFLQWRENSCTLVREQCGAVVVVVLRTVCFILFYFVIKSTNRQNQQAKAIVTRDIDTASHSIAWHSMTSALRTMCIQCCIVNMMPSKIDICDAQFLYFLLNNFPFQFFFLSSRAQLYTTLLYEWVSVRVYDTITAFYGNWKP